MSIFITAADEEN